MPPRKRRKNVSEESDWQCSSKEDAGPEGSSDDFPGRKIGVENPLIVISDSEGEEAKEENTMSKKRGRLQLDRRRTGCKRRIAQMTEEEQFALAVKISEQEANHGNYSAEEESELLRKAIEESLYSCEVSDIPEKVSEQELKKENSSINEDICSTELDKALPLSQSSDQGIVKSPVVSLIRLSQDIVESSSVILSPNCKDLFSEIGSEPHTPCLSNTSAFSSKCATQQLALSPIFPKQSPLSLKLFPRKLFPGKSPGSTGFQEDVDDQFSHCSESSEHDSVSLLPISPPKSMKMENSLQKMIDEKSALFNGDSAILDAKESASTFSTDISEHEGIRVQQTEGSVHYYWGVPFCPKGVDPNVYTQVILCQLEVYQKSLKRAQRQLLHKMDFGEPIDLVAASHQNEKGDSQGSVSQEDQRDECVPKLRPESDCEESENSDKSVTRRVSSRRRQFENKMHSPQDEESSVAPQEEPACSTSQTLFMEVNLVECAGDDPEEASESVPSLIDEANGKSPGEQHEDVQAEEQEITVCPETQPTPAEVEEEEPEIEKVELAEASSPAQSITTEPAPEAEEPEIPQEVECPMCGQQFSLSQIEMHAAYCDGEKQETVLRSRRKLTQRNLAGPSNLLPNPDFGKFEKCYLCKTVVQLEDYQTHVDNCLKMATLETPRSRRLRSTKQESKGQNGRLLSMLDKSEAITSGANSSLPEVDCMRISPPREENNESMNNEDLTVSDSPIRSFVSISEATDCLVDFKKQFSRQPGGGGPRRHAKGQPSGGGPRRHAKGRWRKR